MQARVIKAEIILSGKNVIYHWGKLFSKQFLQQTAGGRFIKKKTTNKIKFDYNFCGCESEKKMVILRIKKCRGLIISGLYLFTKVNKTMIP